MATIPHFWTERPDRSETLSTVPVIAQVDGQSGSAALQFTPEANATYYLFWQGLLDQLSTSHQAHSRLRHVNEDRVIGQSIVRPQLSSVRATAGGLGIYTAGASPAPQTFQVEHWTNNDAQACGITGVGILALKKTANSVHAEALDETPGQTSGTQTAAVSLQWTPGSTGDYYIVGSMEVNGASGNIVRADLYDGTTSYGQCNPIGYNSGAAYVTYFFGVRASSLSGAQNWRLRFWSNGSVNVKVRNARLIALRLSDFEVAQYNENTARTTTSSTSLQDRASAAFTPAAHPHIAFASCLLDHNNTTNLARAVLDYDGTTRLGEDLRQSASTGAEHPCFRFWRNVPTAAPHTWKTRYSASGGGTTGITAASILVLDLGAAASTAPTATNDTASCSLGQTIDIDVLANDQAAPGYELDVTTLEIVSAPGGGNGTATVVGGKVRYVAPSSGAGDKTFTYRVKDTSGATWSNTATVTVTVAALPAPPVIEDQTLRTTFGRPVSVDVVDESGSAAVVTQPSNGEAEAAAEVIVYTPRNPFVGTDSFTFKVVDEFGQDSNVATMTVLVEDEAQVQGALGVCAGFQTTTIGPVGVNPIRGLDAIGAPPVRQPLARADFATVEVGKSVLINVLANDDPSEGAAILAGTLTITSAPAVGSAAIEGGQIRYTAPGSGTALVTLEYSVRDTNGGISAPAVVTITLEAAPSPVGNPTAAADSAAVAAGGQVQIDVLANDTPSGGQTLQPQTLEIVAAPSLGTAIVQGGQVLYTSTGSASAVDTFTYRVKDSGGGTSSAATVTVTITAASAPQKPMAAADFAAVDLSQAIDIDVAANDTASPGATLTPSSIQLTQPTGGNGTVALLGNGRVRYTAPASGPGAKTFSYTIADSSGQRSDPAIVTVTVNSPPALPLTFSNGYRVQAKGMIAQQSAALADFLCFVEITAPQLRAYANGGMMERGDGGDLIVTDGSDVEVPYARLAYSEESGRILIAFLRTLSNSAAVEYRVYAGKPGDSDQQDRSGALAGWLMAWLLSDGVDLTGNGRHLVLTDVTATTLNGIPAGAFNGTTSLAKLTSGATHLTGKSGLTFLAQLKATAAGTDKGILLVGSNAAPGADGPASISYRHDADGFNGGTAGLNGYCVEVDRATGTQRIEGQASKQTTAIDVAGFRFDSAGSPAVSLFAREAKDTATYTSAGGSGNTNLSGDVYVGRGGRDATGQAFAGSIGFAGFYDGAMTDARFLAHIVNLQRPWDFLSISGFVGPTFAGTVIRAVPDTLAVTGGSSADADVLGNDSDASGGVIKTISAALYGTTSIVSGQVRYAAAAAAAVLTESLVVEVERDGIRSKAGLRVSIAAGGVAGQDELPYGGAYYWCGESPGNNLTNIKLNSSTTRGVIFFRAARTETMTHLRFEFRTNNANDNAAGYSKSQQLVVGDNSWTYEWEFVEIGDTISNYGSIPYTVLESGTKTTTITGVQSGAQVVSDKPAYFPKLALGTGVAVTKGRVYALIVRHPGGSASNYFSLNGHTRYRAGGGPTWTLPVELHPPQAGGLAFGDWPLASSVGASGNLSKYRRDFLFHIEQVYEDGVEIAPGYRESFWSRSATTDMRRPIGGTNMVRETGTLEHSFDSRYVWVAAWWVQRAKPSSNLALEITHTPSGGSSATYTASVSPDVVRPLSEEAYDEIQPQDGVTDLLCLAQTRGSSGNLTLNGLLISGGSYTAEHGCAVSLTSTGNLSARSFTVTGTTQSGADTEAITGPNANTVYGTKKWLTISQISVNGAVGTAVEVGLAPGICLPQTRSGAGNLTLNGHRASGGTITFLRPERLCLMAAGNVSSVDFTITGTADDGSAQTETVSGPSSSTNLVHTRKAFKTVTQIESSATVGSAVRIATGVSWVAFVRFDLGSIKEFAKGDAVVAKLSSTDASKPYWIIARRKHPQPDSTVGSEDGKLATVNRFPAARAQASTDSGSSWSNLLLYGDLRADMDWPLTFEVEAGTMAA